ncbi:hypothetical protein LINPERHAP1_LOCUS30198 [Linum perenne]
MHKSAYFCNSFAYKYVHILGDVAKSAILYLLENPTTCSDPMRTMKELKLYEDAKSSFGRELAIRGRSEFDPSNSAITKLPYRCLNTFGDCAPTLQKIAIRALSQTSTSSECGRNCSVFVRIHTERRNKFEEDKLCDFVFVHYNLKLKNRATYFFNLALAYKYVDIPEDVVKSAVLNLLEKPTMCSDPMTTMKKLKLYEEAKSNFG